MKKQNKKDERSKMAIPAGLFIGLGLGFILGNIVGYLLLGLGIGFLISYLDKRK